jgi:hypothetical protein
MGARGETGERATGRSYLYRPVKAIVKRLIASLPIPGTPQSVNASAVPTAARPGPILWYCDSPGPDSPVVKNGFMLVKGWALSKAGIEDIRVLVDGHPCESLSYGALRSDVAAAHPEFQDSVNCGFFGRVAVDGLAAGEHSLVLALLTRDGGRSELTRQFRVSHKAEPDRAQLDAEYLEWLAQRSPSGSELEWMRNEGERLPYQPIISLVVPVHDTPEDCLRMMTESVLAQTYGNWELCLADGASPAPHVRPFLDRLTEQDPRVKVSHQPQNLGMAGQSNAALALATGEFIGLLDPHDVLTPTALFEVVSALNGA